MKAETTSARAAVGPAADATRGLGSPAANAIAVARLTAVWALAESALGGILHALKVPLMGLVMAGTAVILISLIARFAERPRDILRATLLVLVVKAVGAPHTNIQGYTAVAFQGLLAWGIYSVRAPGRLSTGAFALGALVETALQRILVLWILFGEPLWEAVDAWGLWVRERYFPAYVDADFSLAYALMAFYLGVYVVGGLAVGWIASGLPARILAEQQRLSPELIADWTSPGDLPAAATRRGRRRRRWRAAAAWLLIALALAGTVYLGQAGGLSPGQSAAMYLVRTLAILAIWFFLVGPWLSRLVHRWLTARGTARAAEVDAILDALPRLRALATAQFRELRREHTGPRLYTRWAARVLALSLVAR